MKISRSTKIVSGLGAIATILVFGGENTTAMQHHHHKSIMAHVHTHAHSHGLDKDKAVHDHWAMGEILEQHGSGTAAKDVLTHMHRPEVEAH